MKYDPSKIEPKWQKVWQENALYSTPENPKNKKYILDMYPYPSGATMHVGHLEGYVGTDILSRYYRMRGFDVLHPMGWDSFGLPAENYAVKTGIHPEESTRRNIETFKRQLKSSGLSYDWEHEINSSDPEYYKWNQWLFNLMFRKGLAYKKEADVNWCPSCETVLANEQVVDGKCERCETPVVLKKLDQWFLKITAYADRLISGLEGIDWLNEVKVQQKNWIGRSEGTVIKFPLVLDSAVASLEQYSSSEVEKYIDVFTTRPDTLYGATFVVLSPEHELMGKLLDSTVIPAQAFGSEAQARRAGNYLNGSRIKSGMTEGGDQNDKVRKYVEQSKRKTELERKENKEKTGVFTGIYAINPATGEEIPVWVADYVLPGYGTGAIMAVPAHDERDFEFAKKYGLPIVPVIARSATAKQSHSASGPVGSSSRSTSSAVRLRSLSGTPSAPATHALSGSDEGVYTGEGTIVNSGDWNGLKWPGDIEKILSDIESKGWGERKTTYHLRDWLISRQRYWGTPIPMVFCPACAKEGKGYSSSEVEKADSSQVAVALSNSNPISMAGWYPVFDADLPVLLPTDIDFKPTGESPIARSKSFQEGVTCPSCGGPARREVDTMDGYVDSSWYFIRFADSHNDKEFANQKLIKKWLPVDIYVGGGHVVQHLLFARFFWKVLYDEGLIDQTLGDEPFLKLRAPGWILGPDWRKMSKRWGNVVTPDDIIPKYGADTLRMYELFMGPFEASKPWNVTGVEGMSRFVRRVWTLSGKISNFQFPISNEEEGRRVYRMIHKTIKRVTEDIEALKFNTAIAGLMEYVNFLDDLLVKLEGQEIKRPEGAVKVACAELDEAGKTLLLLMAPFAPHMTEELWHTINSSSIHQQPWPQFNPELVTDEVAQIPVQINGKVRGTVTVQSAKSGVQGEVEILARANPAVAKYLDGKEIKKVIFVPGRLINFVTQ